MTGISSNYMLVQSMSDSVSLVSLVPGTHASVGRSTVGAMLNGAKAANIIVSESNSLLEKTKSCAQKFPEIALALDQADKSIAASIGSQS